MALKNTASEDIGRNDMGFKDTENMSDKYNYISHHKSTANTVSPNNNSTASTEAHADISSLYTNTNTHTPKTRAATTHQPKPSSNSGIRLTAHDLTAHNETTDNEVRKKMEANKLLQAARSLGIDTSSLVLEDIVKSAKCRDLLPMERFMADM